MKRGYKFLIFGVIISFILIFLSSSSYSKSESKISQKVISALDENDKIEVAIFTKQELKIASEGKPIKASYKVISKAELQELQNNSEIEKVEYRPPLKIFLQESTGIVNATNTWAVQISNTNLTGAGQTVCVIDTGINSSHPDLAGKVLGGYDFVNNDNYPLDDNGHGTHVAGIIAANGGIKGIAPDAKLIAIKACDSSGTCLWSNVTAGLSWCIDNSFAYNISVISLSLGSVELYSAYCDSLYLEVASLINSAVAKNISVVIATGNDGNTTAISLPACIQNATAVAATYDANIGGRSWTPCNDGTTSTDKICCFSNRNSLTDLFAPGALINSTSMSGSYEEKGGTSMATPHVAAAIAILQQFANSKLGRDYTASEAESILNSTGKIINDSAASKLNYSRINVFAALDYIANSTSPKYEWISSPNQTWPNNAILINLTVTGLFDPSAYNITINSQQYIMNKSSASYYYQYTPSEEGNFTYNCTFADPFGNANVTDSKLLVVNSAFQPLISYKISPLNNVISKTAGIDFKINSTAASLKNATLYLWDSSNILQINTTNITGIYNETNWSYSLSDGTYLWNVYICDSSSNCSWTDSNFTLTIDTTVSISGGGGGGSKKKINETVQEEAYNATAVMPNIPITEEAGYEPSSAPAINAENHNNLITANAIAADSGIPAAQEDKSLKTIIAAVITAITNILKALRDFIF